eukprot:4345479-Amphidinium_carterae.1
MTQESATNKQKKHFKNSKLGAKFCNRQRKSVSSCVRDFIDLLQGAASSSSSSSSSSNFLNNSMQAARGAHECCECNPSVSTNNTNWIVLLHDLEQQKSRFSKRLARLPDSAYGRIAQKYCCIKVALPFACAVCSVLKYMNKLLQA